MRKLMPTFLAIFFMTICCTAVEGQDNLPTVPTAIFVGNAAFEAPIKGAKVALTLQEDFENQKRPVSTFIGEYMSDTAGTITVSLVPDKSYLITTSKDGYYTQLSKIKTTNFSRTRKNKKGISLRPRNVISIKGNINIPEGIEGQITLTNKATHFTRTQKLGPTGDYEIKAVKGDDYELHVFIEGMIDTVVTIDEGQLAASSANQPFVYNFVPNAPQPNFRAGDAFPMETFNLKFIDRTPRISSEIWIDTLTQILLKNPAVKFEIQIHTDSRKSDRLNLILSQKRAELLQEEFVERGVSSQQYTFEMKGEDEVLNHCVDGVSCSKKEHAINNRVQIVVVSGAFIYKED